MKHESSFIRMNLLVVSFLIALSAVFGPVYAEGSWQVQKASGCKTWNSNAETYTSFTWTGGCKNGYIDGVGTLQWSEADTPGDKYIGQYLRGKAHGKGTFTWAFPAARYEGDFVNGQRSGKGIQDFANGDRYEGDWREDQPHGKGLYVWINEDQYRGDFLAGKAHGRGVKTWIDGTRYKGDFVDGQPHGKGVQTWIKGARYEGDFFNGQMHGFGVITLRDERVFRGRWENNNYIGP